VSEGGNVALELLLSLDTCVRDLWLGNQEFLLGSSVGSGNDLLLVSGKRQKFAFFLGAEALEGFRPLLDFFVQNWKEWVVLVLHNSCADSLQSTLEELVFDLFAGSWVLDGCLDLLKGSLGDGTEQLLEVGLLVSLNGGEHGLSSNSHVILDSKSLVGEEVRECALLDEIVLIVDGNVLHLLLGVHEVILLDLLDNIIPSREQLSHLVVGIGVVPVGELWSNDISEVAGVDEGQVEAEDVLVMEDHTSNPLVMGPATES